MKNLIKQMMRFVFVGGTATLLDMGILYLLNYHFGINHHIAATIAFVIATFYNYHLSMKFVFKSKFEAGDRHKEFLAFFILSIVGLLITLLGLAIFVDWLKWDVMVSKILVGVIVMIFNFVTRKIYFEGEADLQ
ncbi:GtrA family protein [Facklamia miroungae]|uniref:Putative flippase GtrA (Transmembrane translocase of bactoprenol-linked glucose) n=1 Tax=Facklamia miroungae TaxID=120956 RepID=A0A1G7TL42_9LACT|nr:GtrA family protein [Facklamia miroungae]NKZ29790.1 GtrA family protein [Facklamia miroungae]SDG36048.1 Putative flippase GtrA (transmembrane translocase of bactoprenol-linked glucose) [Facklamia miroungae]